jgi:hypothetical protein
MRTSRRQGSRSPRKNLARVVVAALCLVGVDPCFAQESNPLRGIEDPCRCDEELRRIGRGLHHLLSSPKRSKREIGSDEVLGVWCWKHNCPVSGIWTGVAIFEGSSDRLTGRFFQCAPGEPGHIIRGSIRNSDLFLVREMSTFPDTVRQIWKGEFLSSVDDSTILIGQASHAFEICNLFAVKKGE